MRYVLILLFLSLLSFLLINTPNLTVLLVIDGVMWIRRNAFEWCIIYLNSPMPCSFMWHHLHRVIRFVHSYIRSGAWDRAWMWWTSSPNRPHRSHQGCCMRYCLRRLYHFQPFCLSGLSLWNLGSWNSFAFGFGLNAGMSSSRFLIEISKTATIQLRLHDLIDSWNHHTIPRQPWHILWLIYQISTLFSPSS